MMKSSESPLSQSSMKQKLRHMLKSSRPKTNTKVLRISNGNKLHQNKIRLMRGNAELSMRKNKKPAKSSTKNANSKKLNVMNAWESLMKIKQKIKKKKPQDKQQQLRRKEFKKLKLKSL